MSSVKRDQKPSWANAYNSTKCISFNRSGVEVFGWLSTCGILAKEHSDGVCLNVLGLILFEFIRVMQIRLRKMNTVSSCERLARRG